CRAVIALFCIHLSGCTAITAASAIPGVLYGVVADQFTGEEESFPYTMRSTLAATQKALQSMQLDIDVLEIQDDGGYGVAFNNDRLDGEIELRKQTKRLTTIYIKVKATIREESVERAIIQLIDAKLRKAPRAARFQREKYNNLRAEPTIKSTRVGWFRPGATLDARKTGEPGWLKIKMPSGKTAFLKGSMVQ
ncbi:MAG: DUF3568 family protein, partial [Mariprofundus sp.]